MAQGPTLITKILHHLCNNAKTEEMNPDRCIGFKALPVKEGLAITYEQRRYFFEEQFLNEALRLIKNSTTIHMRNSITSSIDKAPKMINNLQNYLGRHQCPSVFSLIEKWL